MRKRGSGVLCHITSLDSPYGIGDLGPGAYAFVDFLGKARQSYWQVLPLNPTNRRYSDSPFSSLSSCAGNTALISPKLLVADGLLSQAEIDDHPRFARDAVEYERVSHYKQQLFVKAHRRFAPRAEDNPDFERFCRGNEEWLEDYALGTALAAHLGGTPLTRWPGELSDRRSPEVRRLREELHEAVQREKFLQYTFFRQWHALKNYCNGKGIGIIGDFPMFMNYDAVDIWAHPELFKVDGGKNPVVQAGSPPDAFSEKGQLFNCAVYDWEALREQGFAWWLRRFHYLFRLYDFVRIDHFRGLVSYWEVPAGAQDGMEGTWQQTPTGEFMETMLRHYPSLPVIAEDLGTITADVREVMTRYRIPGMKVVLLGFQKESREQSYLPHNHKENSVAYTGTHDTNTATGWFRGAASEEKEGFARYVGREVEQEASWEMMRLAMMSVARTAVLQMQDVVGGGEESRMNTPGKSEGNWQWRLPPVDLAPLAARLAQMTSCYGRG